MNNIYTFTFLVALSASLKKSSITRFCLYFFQAKEVGPEHAEYAFPAVVLDYLRSIAPGDIKGEIKEVIKPGVQQRIFKTRMILPLI